MKSIPAAGRRSKLRLAALVLLLTSATGAAAQPLDQAERASIEAALAREGVSGRLDAQVVVSWNEEAHDIAFAEDQFLTFKGQRALAIMHLAMHDALNSIVPVYERYAEQERRIVADPIAAAAQAAHDVLAALYPDQKVRLDTKLAVWLGASGTLRDRGIALGRRTAATILALRANDGWDVQGTYEFRDEPGQYQTTPPWNGVVAQPGFRFARPFASGFVFRRPPPPPRLPSAAYARALSEVQTYGALDSSARTADQTSYAVWWMEFAEGSVNRLGRQLVVERDVHLWASARLFAQIAVALYDTYVAVWDSKYEYNHWRPYTAVRAADTDGNPRTPADPAWEPLRPTPPFPEYVSAHAAACAASFGILEATLGRRVSFTMETTTAPPEMPSRSFPNFDAAARECADSRVRLGWHFRYSTDAGLDLGARLARQVFRHVLRRPGVIGAARPPANDGSARFSSSATPTSSRERQRPSASAQSRSIR